ncbi:hypothetical protein IQ249_13425 [Lusitaniella coriacea LEGE 07157]|uniref:Uncharacterized protein n=1 Tax=Lusitaniella coriacea LEGE 07157 TaxID=945747 RepID=A0A8J7DX41_9CYAN|nr:hypothetical protein [Lusitaniella coriacea]MBE9116902.1 hypothetical protein [Lusitaniella coriacea LEGE 07157]
MADKEWQTDEDRMIARLLAHRDVITWVIKRLKSEGISCERTTGNNSSGDILYYKTEDEPRVKEVIREINFKYNRK